MAQPKSFLIFFVGGEGTSHFCEVIGNARHIYIPAFEPLDCYHEHIKGMTEENKLNWLRQLYTLPVKNENYDLWLKDIESINSQIPVMKDKEKILNAKSAGIKMRSYSICRQNGRNPLQKFLYFFEANSPRDYQRLFRLLKDRKYRDGQGHKVFLRQFGDFLQASSFHIYRRQNVIKRAVSAYRKSQEDKNQFSKNKTPAL